MKAGISAMTLNLKTTILASAALAGLLNLVQFALTYDQNARAAFSPKWALKNPSQPSPSPALAASPVTPTPDASDTVPDPIAKAATQLSKAGLKPTYTANYLYVQDQTGTPWQLLAAVHQVETGQRGDTGVKSSAGATGPMQFMPATFAAYGADGDGDGIKNITDLDDSMLGAGRYLAANGAARGNYKNALYRYNNSNTYVSNVLSIARRLGL